MSLLCRSKVKALALAVSKEARGGKFNRVGKSFYMNCEANLRLYIEQRVKSHPSMGVTLQ